MSEYNTQYEGLTEQLEEVLSFMQLAENSPSNQPSSKVFPERSETTRTTIRLTETQQEFAERLKTTGSFSTQELGLGACVAFAQSNPNKFSEFITDAKKEKFEREMNEALQPAEDPSGNPSETDEVDTEPTSIDVSEENTDSSPDTVEVQSETTDTEVSVSEPETTASEPALSDSDEETFMYEDDDDVPPPNEDPEDRYREVEEEDPSW